MMNPPKFNQIDDMANMTFLNKASVLDNLCQHYTHTRIYDLKGQRGKAKQHGVMAGQERVLTRRASLCRCKLAVCVCDLNLPVSAHVQAPFPCLSVTC